LSLPDLAIRRPVLTGVVLIILFLFGLFSLSEMELDLLPEIDLPMAVVFTPYDDAAPPEVEDQVTRPIEGAMATVGGVDSIRSESREGSSMVVVSFDWGTDLDSATFEMREALDMVRGVLPDDADDSRVIRLDPGMLPVTTLSISGIGDVAEMQEVAEDFIIPRLERIDGVASVDLSGGRDRQVQVRLDPGRLEHYGIDLETVGEVLMASNLNLPGGTLEEGARAYTIRTLGEFESVEDIAAVKLPTGDGGAVRVDEVAEVREAEERVESITRLDGEASIALSVNKESGANTVLVSSRVKEAMAGVRDQLPPGLMVAEVMDQGTFIVASIQQVLQNGLVGGALAILILFLFLRDWRSTLVTALAIPFAAVVSLTFLYFAGLTLNLLSMGGLALGIGMMVDNAIVVLENVFRKLSEGLGPARAAVEGTAEVGAAITASTLTTLSVFLPIVFTEGLAAEIFSDLSLTVSAALAASLLVALTGVPLFASRLLRRIPESEQKARRDAGKRGLSAAYRRFLTWSLHHRALVIIAVVLVLASVTLAVPHIETEFLPEMDDGQIMVDVELPPGTALDETDRVIGELEEVYQAIPEVESILAYSGTTAGVGMGGADPSTGQVQLTLVDRDRRERTSTEVADEVRVLSREVPGMEVTVTPGMMAGMADAVGGFGGPAVVVEFRGDDLDALRDLTDRMADDVSRIAGTYDVRTSFDEGSPELRLVVDRSRAASLGVTPAQIARTVRTASVGETVTRFRREGTELDVVMVFPEEAVADRPGLLRIPIALPNGSVVPLVEVVDLGEALGPTTIERVDQSRVGSVTANVSGRAASLVNEEVEAIARAMELPPGYTIDFEGEQALIEESFEVLTTVAVMGFILMYLIMAAQFESFAFPISVILTVPMSLAGIAWVLAITGRTFDVAAFVGLIMVMGIIVNNAIVMVDYTNQLRRGGMARREATITAGTVRMRPVLMTALTTVLAMIPLALGIGEGAEMQVPLATTVMGGLGLGTILTLVVLPVIYTLIDDITGGMKADSLEGAEGGDDR